MLITATNLTKGGGSSTASLLTNSISPTANRLILLTVTNNINNGAGTANDPTVTGASMTWTEVATRQSSGMRITVFRALSSSPGSGQLTIDFAGQSQHDINYSIDSFANIDISGTNGANAIVQSPTNSANATTGSVTLATLQGALSFAFGACLLGAGGITLVKGSNFTELANENFNASTVLETEYARNQTTVNWTWDGSSQTYWAIAAEIKPGPDGGLFFGQL